MFEPIYSFTPEFAEAFVKVCASRGLSVETTVELLKRAQNSELAQKSPDYVRGFQKKAFFRTLGAGADKVLGVGGRLLGGLGKGIARHKTMATGLGLAGAGAAGIDHVAETYRKGRDFEAANFFSPDGLEKMIGGAGKPSGTSTPSTTNPFDYVNAINRVGSGAPAAAAGGGAGSQVSKVRQDLDALTQQEGVLQKAWDAARDSNDPAAVSEGWNARKQLTALQAQRNSLTRQLDQLVGGARTDKNQVQSSARNAISAIDRLSGGYSDKLRSAADSAENPGWLPFSDSASEARTKADHLSQMLSRLAAQRAAATNALNQN